jgi:hypothetical protein
MYLHLKRRATNVIRDGVLRNAVVQKSKKRKIYIGMRCHFVMGRVLLPRRRPFLLAERHERVGRGAGVGPRV